MEAWRSSKRAGLRSQSKELSQVQFLSLSEGDVAEWPNAQDLKSCPRNCHWFKSSHPQETEVAKKQMRWPQKSLPMGS